MFTFHRNRGEDLKTKRINAKNGIVSYKNIFVKASTCADRITIEPPSQRGAVGAELVHGEPGLGVEGLGTESVGEAVGHVAGLGRDLAEGRVPVAAAHRACAIHILRHIPVRVAAGEKGVGGGGGNLGFRQQPVDAARALQRAGQVGTPRVEGGIGRARHGVDRGLRRDVPAVVDVAGGDGGEPPADFVRQHAAVLAVIPPLELLRDAARPVVVHVAHADPEPRSVEGEALGRGEPVLGVPEEAPDAVRQGASGQVAVRIVGRGDGRTSRDVGVLAQRVGGVEVRDGVLRRPDAVAY